MINGKALNKGGSVYIYELDQTYSKNDLYKMYNEDFKMLCGFMNEKELCKVLNLVNNSYKAIIVENIFDRL